MSSTWGQSAWILYILPSGITFTNLVVGLLSYTMYKICTYSPKGTLFYVVYNSVSFNKNPSETQRNAFSSGRG